MADIFFSYASEDRDAVSKLVSIFETAGYSVWWDRALKVGASFDKQIEIEIQKCSCVLVVWSTNSLSSDWVRAEAGEGLERGILIQVLLEDLRPPLVFRQQHAFIVDNSAEPNFASLFDAIEITLDGTTPKENQSVRNCLCLVADFKGPDGESYLSQALVQAIEIGLKHPSHVFVYPRDSLVSIAELRKAYLDVTLPLAESEGLHYVIGGSIDSSNGALLLKLELFGVSSGTRTNVSEEINSRSEIMTSLGRLLADITSHILGEDAEIVTRRIQGLDIECLFEDQLGGDLMYEQQHEAAVTHFANALARDESFIPSYLGLAIAYDSLDRLVECKKAIEKALDFISLVSERESLNTQAFYYLYHSANIRKALEHFLALEKLSPLDTGVINNIAVAQCDLLDFKGAVDTLQKVVRLAPDKVFYKANLALYHMYAGEFHDALQLAEGIISKDHDIFDAHVAKWCSEYGLGQLNKAETTLGKLAESDEWYTSNVRIGLADICIAAGNLEKATKFLKQIPVVENSDILQWSMLIQAEIELANGRPDETLDLIKSTISGSLVDPNKLASAAIVSANLNDTLVLQKILLLLKRHLDDRSQAYVRMVNGLLLSVEQDYSGAEQAFKDAIGICDLWILHFVLAELYTTLNMRLESNLEWNICIDREGEGVCAYINRLPTCRLLARARSQAN